MRNANAKNAKRIRIHITNAKKKKLFGLGGGDSVGDGSGVVLTSW